MRTAASHEPFRDRVRKRYPIRCADDLGTFGGEHSIEAVCELIAVANQQADGKDSQRATRSRAWLTSRTGRGWM